jgi:hypothetical protein
MFDLLGDGVETDVSGSANLLNICGSHCESGGWELGGEKKERGSQRTKRKKER